MAQIPIYDSPQVQEQALPGARQQSVMSPDLLNVRADREIKTGEGLQEAGATLNRAAIQMKHEDDLRSVQEATARYQEATQNFTLDARDKRTGDAAQGLVTDFDKFHADTVEQLSKTLKNPEQQRAFGVMAGRSRLATRHDLGGFELGERRKATDASFEALSKNTINAGAISATDDAAMVQRDLLVNSTRAYAAQRNMNGDQEKALTEKILTDFHAQRIQNLVQQDPMRAQEYFEQHKGEIAGSQQAEIGGFAKKATATAQGSAAADGVWQQLGPKNNTDPVNVADMEDRIRKDLKGNEPAIEAAIKGVRERDAAFKNQRVEQSRADESSVNQLVLKGVGGEQLRTSPEFINLSNKNPQAARSIMDYVENKSLRAVQRAAAAESRADAAESRAERRLHRDTLDVAMQVSDPEVLAGMTRDQVVNLLPRLGATSTQALLGKWETLTKNGTALSEAKVDDQQFKMFAQRAGLDITPKAGDDAAKERLISVRDEVERAIGVEQQAKKKPLSRAEKDTIMQRMLDDKVMQRKFWGLGDSAVPAVALPVDDQKSAYVMVNDKKVTLSEIPGTYRANAIAKLQARKLPVTQSNIAGMWAADGMPKGQ